MHKHTNLIKIMHQSYQQAYTKSSNDNTCKIKQNNNKKSVSIAIETAKCLALHHTGISTKNGKKKGKSISYEELYACTALA
jgi:hypothetical protein